MSVLQGQHAFVTGANRGIGAAIVRKLAAAGADVTLCVRSAASADAVVADIRAMGRRAQVVLADVTDRAALTRACADAANTLGPITILVNNAGIVETVPFLKSETGVFDRMIAVHLTAPVVATQAVLPEMLERGSGHVVNVASIAGLAGTAYVAAYVSAKHAMVGLTRALAAEFGHKGVRVNAVCPGYTDTDLVGDSVGKIIAKTGRSREEAMAMILKDAGQKRLVTVDEVADAVLAFVTPGATANGAAVPLMGDDA